MEMMPPDCMGGMGPGHMEMMPPDTMGGNGSSAYGDDATRLYQMGPQHMEMMPPHCMGGMPPPYGDDAAGDGWPLEMLPPDDGEQMQAYHLM